jgi:trans-feruloyl-CoA hydratase/vanillin synthase
MSPTLNREMMDVLNALEFRDDVGVLVLTGEGTAWSAGMDLKEYFRETEAKGLGASRQAQRESYGWWRRLRWYQKPTIAMVNGWCFGGGYGPLFACDLAFAADEAQFGLSEINWGILPGGGATKVAVELLPFRKAMYHAMMGENVDGKTAAEWGLVNEALPLADLKERVTAVANVLLKKNPVALKATKDAVRRVGVLSYDDAEDYLIRAQEAANSYDNEGRKEGIKQFIDDKTFKPGLGAYDRSKQQA